MRKIEIYSQVRQVHDDGKLSCVNEWQREFTFEIEYPDETDLKQYGSLVETVVAKAVNAIQVMDRDIALDATCRPSQPIRYLSGGIEVPEGELFYKFCLLNFMTHELKYIHERITKS